MAFTLRWGILATGGIATTFTKDLLTNPAIRNVHDVKHSVVAAASSSSKDRATEFLKTVNAPSSQYNKFIANRRSTAKAYGSYFELMNDRNVDIVYVATPHSHHFQNTMLALLAGKHVLCEKAFTVNAQQAKKLVETAKEKNLFLMEAVWTRYFPLSITIRDMVKNKDTIGEVFRVIADLSIGCADPSGGLTFDDSNRMVNKDLAGGALLDLGIYALTWNFQILYHCQPKPREEPKVVACMNKYAKTGVDEMTSMILQFPKSNKTGIALTGMRVSSDPDREGSAGPSIKIQGTKGEIIVWGPAYRPTAYTVVLHHSENKAPQRIECPIPTDPARDNWGHGMFWEADEAARCIRDGKKESETLSWEESIVIMETMDAIRKQGSLEYPELIETSVYDEQSPLNGGR